MAVTGPSGPSAGVLYVHSDPRRTDHDIITSSSRPSCTSNTSTISQLPHEPIQEILPNISVLSLTEMYFQYAQRLAGSAPSSNTPGTNEDTAGLEYDMWTDTGSRWFWWRLSGITLCVGRYGADHRPTWDSCPDAESCWEILTSQVQYFVRIFGMFGLVLTVRGTLVVDLEDVADRTTEPFVECLATLPNLHTPDILSRRNGQISRSFATATGNGKLKQARTLVLPPAAHRLSRFCPKAGNFTR